MVNNIAGHCGSGVDATSVPVRFGRQTARRLPVSVLAKTEIRFQFVSVFITFLQQKMTGK